MKKKTILFMSILAIFINGCGEKPVTIDKEKDMCEVDSDCKYVPYTGECHTPEYVAKQQKEAGEKGILLGEVGELEDITCTCESNSCITYTNEPTENKKCTDTDGGRNYYDKGELTICDFVTKEEPGAESAIGCALHEDFCEDNNNLLEYFCEENEFKLEKYACPNGCEEGVCIKNDESTNFNFIFKYGVGSGNELNTFDKTYTKDMIMDPSITIKFELSESELAGIYQKINDLKLFDKDEEQTEENMFRTPCLSYYLKAQIDSDQKELSWDNCSGEISDKLQQFTDYIILIITSKEEYKELPTPKGGYL